MWHCLVVDVVVGVVKCLLGVVFPENIFISSNDLSVVVLFGWCLRPTPLGKLTTLPKLHGRLICRTPLSFPRPLGVAVSFDVLTLSRTTFWNVPVATELSTFSGGCTIVPLSDYYYCCALMNFVHEHECRNVGFLSQGHTGSIRVPHTL